MHILKIIFICLEVLALFNLLIFVHELGHFLAARWRGLRIDRFAIWFGKPVWKKKIKGVEFALGSLPFGGYVALPQMATMETIEGKTESDVESLPPISALDKIIVAFAGPLFSFLLALAFAVVVWVVGRPVNEAETTTTIGYVIKDGPADKAGLRSGDKILKVDGHPVTKWNGMGESVTWRIVRSEGETIPIEVERDGKPLILQVKPIKEETKPWERKSLRQILVEAAQSAIIAKVYTNSPAALAGLKAQDQITEVDGKKLVHYGEMADYVEKSGSKKLTLKVLRGDQPFEVSVQPEVPVLPADEKPRLGILWLHGGKSTLTHPGAIEQVSASVNAMISTFGALFSRKSDIKAQHLGGAVKILSVYYLLFENEQGWRLALWFSVLMNVNLAILNMLPFPVLDGGHITLALVEAARRKPVSARLLQYVQTACAALLIGYMAYIFFYDVQDLFGKRESVEIKFAPKLQPAE